MRVCPQADFVSSRQSRDETGFCYGALYPESHNNNNCVRLRGVNTQHNFAK